VNRSSLRWLPAPPASQAEQGGGAAVEHSGGVLAEAFDAISGGRWLASVR
jgi:hypothetical protein